MLDSDAQDGFVRYEHVGEGDYYDIETRVVELLNEAKETKPWERKEQFGSRGPRPT